jgi:hypothetical protein
MQRHPAILSVKITAFVVVVGSRYRKIALTDMQVKNAKADSKPSDEKGFTSTFRLPVVSPGGSTMIFSASEKH